MNLGCSEKSMCSAGDRL